MDSFYIYIYFFSPRCKAIISCFFEQLVIFVVVEYWLFWIRGTSGSQIFLLLQVYRCLLRVPGACLHAYRLLNYLCEVCALCHWGLCSFSLLDSWYLGSYLKYLEPKTTKKHFFFFLRKERILPYIFAKWNCVTANSLAWLLIILP